MVFVAVWTAVEFGNKSNDEHERMSEHRQCNRQQLWEVQHYAAADEHTDAKRRRSTDDKSTAERDQDAVEK